MGLIATEHIDCIEYMKIITDKYYDLAIVDPEYGIKESAHRNKSRGKLVNTRKYKPKVWDSDIPPQEYFDELFRVSKHQIIFGINYFVARRNLPIGPGRILWDKVNGKSDFSDGELAYCSFHKSLRIFQFMWNGMQQGKSITEGYLQKGNKKKNQQRIHPTEKPIELYKWILHKYAKPGDKILDTHGGSGSILIACHDLDHNIDWCEIDKDYYNDAVDRFNYYKLQYKIEYK